MIDFELIEKRRARTILVFKVILWIMLVGVIAFLAVCACSKARERDRSQRANMSASSVRAIDDAVNADAFARVCLAGRDALADLWDGKRR